MALQPSSANKLSTNNTVNVLSSVRTEIRNFTWQIEHFKQWLELLIDKKSPHIAIFPFTIV